MDSSAEYETKREDKIIIDKSKCQGCGSCVAACPNGGFRVINGKSTIVKENFCDGLGYCIQNCPMGAISYNGELVDDVSCFINDEPPINNWPIKLYLVNTKHSQFRNADLAIVADCVPAVYRNFNEIAKNHIIITVCPKVENTKEIREKITEIISSNQINSITVYSVDYICCDTLPRIVKDAIRFSKKKDELLSDFKENVICLFGAKK